MKSCTSVFILVCFWHSSFSQHQESFETFLADTTNLDSGQVLIGLSVTDKLVFEKPETIFKSTSQGVVVDERDRRVRHQFQGRMSWVVYPKNDLRGRYQPHLLLEVTGLATYVSTKVGFGITDREDKFSFGCFGGNYIRRVDEYTEFKYRAKHFEQFPLFGGYVHANPENFSVFMSYAIEKKQNYRRISFAWKGGQTLNLPGVLNGLRLHVESEAFLGTGFGLSFFSSETRLAFRASYLVPDNEERKTQRLFGNFLGNGITFSLSMHLF